MGRRCCVPGCAFRQSRKSYAQQKYEFEHGSVTFHSLPEDPILRTKWLQLMPRQKYLTDFICSRHFTPDCFGYFKDIKLGLKQGVCPSSFLTTNSDKAQSLGHSDKVPNTSTVSSNETLNAVVEKELREPHQPSILRRKRSIVVSAPSNKNGEFRIHTPQPTEPLPKKEKLVSQQQLQKTAKPLQKEKNLVSQQHSASKHTIIETEQLKPHQPSILRRKRNITASAPSNKNGGFHIHTAQPTEPPQKKKKLESQQQLNVQNHEGEGLSTVLEKESLPCSMAFIVSNAVSAQPHLIQKNNFHQNCELHIPEAQTTELPSSEESNMPTSIQIPYVMSVEAEQRFMACDTVEKIQMRKQIEKLKKQVQKEKARNAKIAKKVKVLSQGRVRDKIKIISLKKVIIEIGKSQLFTDRDLNLLRQMGKFNEEFLTRQIQMKRGLRVKRTYGPDLRAFACTLHYFSPRAYRFVRNKFGKTLPHPKTITTWYMGVKGDPGFMKEAIQALGAKARSSATPLSCSLAFDEIATRQHVDKNFEGYVDMGEGTESEDRVLATQALVFMVTSLNGKWKIPVGYFLVSSLKADAKAGLVGKCLTLLHSARIRIPSLTFDGTSTNQATAKTLGCNFKLDNFQPWFLHPETAKKVHVFFDPPHMMKLVRNTFAEYGTLYNSDGEPIHWQFIKELHKLQEIEGLHLGNKIRSSHINYQRKKMNVRLAVQVLSMSASKALQVCRELRLEEFNGSEATSDFLERFDKVFDILNSKKENGEGNKKALGHDNKEQVFKFFKEMETYIKGLHFDPKDPEKSKVVDSDRKTGFVGILVCMESAKGMFEDLCEDENSGVPVLKLYRVSQDHLELFFGIIRARGGWNNNPTCRHIKASFRRVLVHFELEEEGTGNCIPMESISMLYCSSASRHPDKLINLTTNATYLLSLGSNFEEDPDDPDPVFDADADEVLDHFNNLTPDELNLFTLNVVTYMAGFVCKTLIKSLKTSLKCRECTSALTKNPVARHRLLLDAKNRGKLVVPGEDAVAIAEDCEKIVRRVIHETKDSNIISKENSTLHLTSTLMRNYISQGINRVFKSLDEHVLEQEPLSNHKYFLIRCFAIRYFDLRLHHVTRGIIEKGQSKRHYWNKLILFSGN